MDVRAALRTRRRRVDPNDRVGILEIEDRPCQDPRAATDIDPGRAAPDVEPWQESFRDASAPATDIGLIAGAFVPVVCLHGPMILRRASSDLPHPVAVRPRRALELLHEVPARDRALGAGLEVLELQLARVAATGV